MPSPYDIQGSARGLAATAQRQAQLDAMNAAWEAQARPGSQRYADRIAAEQEAAAQRERVTYRIGHRQRLHKALATIDFLELCRQRADLLPDEQRRLEQAHRDAEVSREWLDQDELDRSLSQGRSLVD